MSTARDLVAVASAGAVGVATVGAVWAGLSLPMDAADGTNHLWGPLDEMVGIPRRWMVVLGIAILVASWRFRRALGLDRVGTMTVVVVLGVGVWLGATFAVTTAPSVGANIGGGAMLLFTPLVLLVGLGLVLWSRWVERSVRRRSEPPRS